MIGAMNKVAGRVDKRIICCSHGSGASQGRRRYAGIK